eukprot:7714982-Heterocapsa_arctica.AAC.1
MAFRTCTTAGSPSERMRSRPSSPASPSLVTASRTISLSAATPLWRWLLRTRSRRTWRIRPRPAPRSLRSGTNA